MYRHGTLHTKLHGFVLSACLHVNLDFTSSRWYTVTGCNLISYIKLYRVPEKNARVPLTNRKTKQNRTICMGKNRRMHDEKCMGNCI